MALHVVTDSDPPPVAMRSGRANVGEVELAYDVFGSGGKPLLLVMGIGAQRIFWHDELCEQFARAGFHVCRFDNRDVGESTKLDSAAVPHPGRVMAKRFFTGRPARAPYTLADMATDTARLIAALGWQRAHVVGVSMGGMIAQQLVIDHPECVASLTSIMSANGSRRYIPEPRALKALFSPRPKTAKEAGVHLAAMFEILGGGAFQRVPGQLERMGEQAFERGMNPRGFLRHYAAIMAAPDRRPGLRVSAIPTLIIHGTRDPLFPVRAGRDLAQMMPDATWLPLAGMGHDVPAALWPTIVAAVARHAERADARRSEHSGSRATVQR